MDAETIQLLSLGQQYIKVEKETRKLAEELQSSRKKRRQLDAEVRFLHEKVRSFRENLDHDGPTATASDGHQHSKIVGEPQFYEVEVQFADSLDNGMMVHSAIFQYPSSPKDFRNNYISRNEYVPRNEYAQRMYSR